MVDKAANLEKMVNLAILRGLPMIPRITLAPCPKIRLSQLRHQHHSEANQKEKAERKALEALEVEFFNRRSMSRAVKK